MGRVIFHVDVNSAYLSWEAVYRLKHLGENVDLRRIPSAVGGDVNQRHGIILAKSIPAGMYKIRTGDSIWEARQKYPSLTIVPPDYSLYDRCSKSLLQILGEFSPAVEQYSIDEAYMDMSGTERLFGNPEGTEAIPLPNKGYGNSTTTSVDVTEASQARLVLLALAETVGARLRKDRKQAEILSVSIKDYEFRKSSHQCRLPAPTHITEEIHRHACRLFDTLWDGRPVRHLGIHTGRIGEETVLRQENLFDETDYEKLEKWECAVDSIRRRYGADAVKRAVFLKSPVDHMNGGISRKKPYRAEK